MATSRLSARSRYFSARARSLPPNTQTHRITLVPRGLAQAREEPVKMKLLLPYLSWISAFVGQIFADGGDVEVAGLDQRLDGLGDREDGDSPACTCPPTGRAARSTGVGGQVLHQLVHLLVHDGHVGLGRALLPARVLVNLDEAVGEVDR